MSCRVGKVKFKYGQINGRTDADNDNTRSAWKDNG